MGATLCGALECGGNDSQDSCTIRVEESQRRVLNVACIGADSCPDIVRDRCFQVKLEAFAIGIIDVTVNHAHVSGDLDLVAPEHDAAVGAAVAVVAQENVAVDCAWRWGYRE
jgi:hypothetical protein